MLYLPRLLTVACFLLGPSLCLAQDWYQVEIIIFEHSEETQARQRPENWPNNLDLKWPSPLIELAPAAEREQQPVIKPAFEELTLEERRLNNDSYAIRVGDNYNLLWHKAWRAPIQPEEEAPWILVQAGEPIGDHFQLEGGIRIHLSRFLHLHTNLWLTETSGDPIIEQDLRARNDNEQFSDDFNLDRMAAEINAQTRFDWSQLPEVSTVRWACNFVRELWPEDKRLLPADFYEDPAPADWYFPFGCQIPSDINGKDLPIQLNLPTAGLPYRAEIQKRFPELAATWTGNELLDDRNDLTDAPLEPTTSGAPQGIDSRGLSGSRPGQQNPANTHVAEPKVSYQVEEIVHIQSQRRMRSTEYHYIDHPKVGILAIIYPLEKPDLKAGTAGDNNVPPAGQ